MTGDGSAIASILSSECSAIDLHLSADDILSFTLLAEELKKWNSRINLTAITDDKEIAVKHFVDSLHLAALIRSDDRLLDVGSGAGFPVIPLKIARAATSMMSVDCVAKKINFQRHIIRTLALNDIEAVHARVEDMLKKYGNSFTVIVSRAFTRLDHFVERAAPLLSKDGRLIAMKGADVEDEITASSAALSVSGFSVTATYHYRLPFSMGDRTLLVLNPCKAASNKG
jgi:16S rRNA (guanine527-N7)-methyltransferase